MKNSNTVKTIALLIALPLSSFAANAPAQLSMSTSAWLRVISNQIKVADQNSSGSWKKYFDHEHEKRFPKNNTNTLGTVSGYGKMANSYIFTPGISYKNSYGLPLQIFCKTNGNSPYCQPNNSSTSGSEYGEYNPQEIMDFSTQLNPNFSPNNSYITHLIYSLNTPEGTDSNTTDLSATTAIFNALTQIQAAYTPGNPVTVKNAKGKPVSQLTPSPMLGLQNAVKAPFQQAYFEALSTASSTQTLRLNNELLAESNAMKYQIIRQNQRRTILQVSLLAQALKNNQLQKANLATNKAILALLQKRAGK